MAIKGITLRDTAVTYFDPHGLPSGGDWVGNPLINTTLRQPCTQRGALIGLLITRCATCYP